MTEREERAVQALIEAVPDTDPFCGPAYHMARKLELSPLKRMPSPWD
jgi:hypothetical protein